MKLTLKIIKILRAITHLPLRILIFIGDLYSSFLKIIDKRNHDTYWQEIMQKSIDKNISRDIQISNNPNKIIKFHCPTQISSFRAKTFFTKEPETLKWMDQYGSNKKCFYDIGANVGIYSIYYAKKFETDVYAFEPSYRNLNLLSQNIKLNKLEKKIYLIPNPISDKFVISDFFQLDPTAGEANSTFNDSQIKDDLINRSEFSKKKKMINFKTLGLSVDFLIMQKLIRPPNLIKIDVDGNELDIINGLNETIKKIDDISILVETRVNTHQNIEKTLQDLSLKKVNQFRDNSIWQKQV